MSSLIAFLILYVFYAGFSLTIIILSRRKELLLKSFTKKWTDSKKKKIYSIIRWVLRGIAALVIFFFTIPMSIDIPHLISGDYKTVNGSITSYSSNHNERHQLFFSTQTITVEDKEHFTIYWGRYLELGQRVTIVYLPNSRFVLEVKRIR
jgi:hypothetical protein